MNGARGDGSNRKRRGVARQQSIRVADRVELFENVAFELEILRRCFDDQSCFLAIFETGRPTESVDNRRFFFSRNFSPLAAPLEKTANPAETFLDEFLFDVVENRRETRLRRNLS